MRYANVTFVTVARKDHLSFSKKSLRSLGRKRPYVARSLVSGATPRATTELRTDGAAHGTAQCAAGGAGAPDGGRGSGAACRRSSCDKEPNKKGKDFEFLLVVYLYIFIIIHIYVIIFLKQRLE